MWSETKIILRLQTLNYLALLQLRLISISLFVCCVQGDVTGTRETDSARKHTGVPVLGELTSYWENEDNELVREKR